MKILKKWWFWAVVVVIVVAIVAPKGDDVQQVLGDITTTTAKVTTAAKTTTAAPEEKIINCVGESLETKNFIVTVEALNKVKSDNQFLQPAEGKEFVEVVIIIENKSEKDYTVSSVLMFEAYQDSFSVDESFSAHAANDSSTLDGGLAKGKKLKGSLAYELPKDWEELEIQVDLTALSFSTDGEIKVILKNK